MSTEPYEPCPISVTGQDSPVVDLRGERSRMRRHEPHSNASQASLRTSRIPPAISVAVA